jgi:hypothetical protein
MPLSDDTEFESSVRDLRKLLGIEFDARPDMITVIYKLKDRGLIKNYLRVPDAEMPDDEAFFNPFTKILHISERVFEAGNGFFVEETKRQRARFTLAEEVGHIWLKHNGVRYRGQTGKLQEKLVKQIRQEEREARRFAGTFLVPAYLVK